MKVKNHYLHLQCEQNHAHTTKEFQLLSYRQDEAARALSQGSNVIMDHSTRRDFYDTMSEKFDLENMQQNIFICV